MRLTQFAKSLKRYKKIVLRELQDYQLTHPNHLFLYRNTAKPNSPWYVDIHLLIQAGYMNDTVIISREAKALQEQFDNLEERVINLENS
jgi:hypothetical protein